MYGSQMSIIDQLDTATRDRVRLRVRVEELESEEPEWVVNDIGELGVKIHGRVFFLYKGRSLEYSEQEDEDGHVLMYRPVFKREFGEVCHPRDFWPLCNACNRAPCKWPDRYTLGDGWMPVPVPEEDGGA